MFTLYRHMKGNAPDSQFRHVYTALSETSFTLLTFKNSFRNVLYNDFRVWLHEMTGCVDLTDQVDMSCAKYKHTGS